MYRTFFRKRKSFGIFLLVILLCISFLLSACSSDNGSENAAIVPNQKELELFVASDLHLYSNNLIGANNTEYVKEEFSTDGRVQECDYEIVETLVNETNVHKPDFLILTGDLSYNGEKDSHLELAKLLHEIKETQVLVIPGNHDLYSQNAFSVAEDKIKYIHSTNEQDFKDIYADFGYANAYSYDENSLSYIYELAPDQWALMLDTSQSEYNEEYGENLAGGYLEVPTLHWIEENLKYAKEHDISVVSFSHHNLLVHNALFQSNYTLYNYEELLTLFSKYDVNLNLSGHLHIQSIKSEDTDQNTVYDISSGSLLDFGNRYGVLNIYDNCFAYESRPLVFADPLSHIPEYAFRVFADEYYSKTLPKYRSVLGDETSEAAVQLLSEINAYYFDGSYEQIHALTESHKDLIRKIRRNTENYKTSYVRSIIEVPNENQHQLLIER